MAGVINWNGKLVAAADACIPHDSRTFRYGYGLFETLLVREGRIPLGAFHWERLQDGMQQLGFRKIRFWNAVWLEEEVLKTVRKNQLEALCRVRLQIYDGAGGQFHAGNEAPHFLIVCYPIDVSVTQLNVNGLITGIAPGLLKSMDSLSALKSANALLYVMAARHAQEQQWNDALILNTNRQVVESTICNIFWVEQGIIHTPPLSEGCVAGVMRRHLMAQLSIRGIPCHESVLSPERLAAADEVWLTNAIRHIKWIRSADQSNYGCNLAPEISNWLNTPQ